MLTGMLDIDLLGAVDHRQERHAESRTDAAVETELGPVVDRSAVVPPI